MLNEKRLAALSVCYQDLFVSVFVPLLLLLVLLFARSFSHTQFIFDNFCLPTSNQFQNFSLKLTFNDVKLVYLSKQKGSSLIKINSSKHSL
jgi:hypothetical protein